MTESTEIALLRRLASTDPYETTVYSFRTLVENARQFLAAHDAKNAAAQGNAVSERDRGQLARSANKPPLSPTTDRTESPVSAAPATPADGVVSVPREPTHEMIEHARTAVVAANFTVQGTPFNAIAQERILLAAAYRAMVSAAPATPAPAELFGLVIPRSDGTGIRLGSATGTSTPPQAERDFRVPPSQEGSSVELANGVVDDRHRAVMLIAEIERNGLREDFSIADTGVVLRGLELLAAAPADDARVARADDAERSAV